MDPDFTDGDAVLNATCAARALGAIGPGAGNTAVEKLHKLTECDSPELCAAAREAQKKILLDQT